MPAMACRLYQIVMVNSREDCTSHWLISARSLKMTNAVTCAISMNSQKVAFRFITDMMFSS